MMMPPPVTTRQTMGDLAKACRKPLPDLESPMPLTVEHPIHDINYPYEGGHYEQLARNTNTVAELLGLMDPRHANEIVRNNHARIAEYNLLDQEAYAIGLRMRRTVAVILGIFKGRMPARDTQFTGFLDEEMSYVAMAADDPCGLGDGVGNHGVSVGA